MNGIRQRDAEVCGSEVMSGPPMAAEDGFYGGVSS